MTSEASSVTVYLETVPGKRKAALKTIRRLCKDILIGFKGTMAYKLPAYKKDDDIVTGFASQKNHTCFYFAIHEVMLAYKELLKSLDQVKELSVIQTRTRLILK